MAAELGQGRTGALTEQECSSPDTSEQALLEPSRSVSRSEPDLSSITPNTEKATESTAIMIDVHDSAVVQSEDPSLFPEPLSQPSGTLWGWKAACVAFPVHIHQLGGSLCCSLQHLTPVLQGAQTPASPGACVPFSPIPIHPFIQSIISPSSLPGQNSGIPCFSWNICSLRQLTVTQTP